MSKVKHKKHFTHNYLKVTILYHRKFYIYMIRMYDTNEDVLVVRKSDYQNNSIGDGYFLVPKDEWQMEDDGISVFHLYLTKVVDDRLDYYLVNGEYVVILEELPLLKRDDYIEI